jgi:hypothetical protein
MISQITNDFVKLFRQLPPRIQTQARKTYQLWKQHPYHASLDFKRVSNRQPVYSVRVGIGWRVVGIKKDKQIIWFWIGTHAEYDKLITRL